MPILLICHLKIYFSHTQKENQNKLISTKNFVETCTKSFTITNPLRHGCAIKNDMPTYKPMLTETHTLKEYQNEQQGRVSACLENEPMQYHLAHAS